MQNVTFGYVAFALLAALLGLVGRHYANRNRLEFANVWLRYSNKVLWVGFLASYLALLFYVKW